MGLDYTFVHVSLTILVAPLMIPITPHMRVFKSFHALLHLLTSYQELPNQILHDVTYFMSIWTLHVR